jgi:hypothetical protein
MKKIVVEYKEIFYRKGIDLSFEQGIIPKKNSSRFHYKVNYIQLKVRLSYVNPRNDINNINPQQQFNQEHQIYNEEPVLADASIVNESNGQFSNTILVSPIDISGDVICYDANTTADNSYNLLEASSN